MNIKRIVAEEINRFLIRENINNLKECADVINKYANEAQKSMTRLTDNNAKRGTIEILQYFYQIVQAIYRCINKQSLNEDLSQYGLNIPQELGGNMLNAFQRGFYNTKNFLTQNGNGYGNYNQLQQGLKIVPLRTLLANIENKESYYRQLCANNRELSQNTDLQTNISNAFHECYGTREVYQDLATNMQTQQQQANQQTTQQGQQQTSGTTT